MCRLTPAYRGLGCAFDVQVSDIFCTELTEIFCAPAAVPPVAPPVVEVAVLVPGAAVAVLDGADIDPLIWTSLFTNLES
jgi:hypothetical protein